MSISNTLTFRLFFRCFIQKSILFFHARIAHRIFVERARLLRLHSSAEGRITSVDIS